MHKSVFAIFAGALGALISTIAVAQDDSPATDVELEEVIVTATRTERNLQDVPISVAAYSGDFLQDRHLVNFEEIVVQTPGLNLTTATRTSSRPVFRGSRSH